MSEWVQWISPIAVFVIGLLSYLNARRQNRTTEQRAEDEHEDGIAERRRLELQRVYERLDALEGDVTALKKRDVAFGNVLRDAANQWPSDRPGPVFNPADTRVIEDTFPAAWRKRPPRAIQKEA